MSLRLVCCVSIAGLVTTASPALAHIALDYPPMRGGDQKQGPCEGVPKGEPTVLAPGQTITVSWRETVDHPSHYRIAFDSDGEDDFVDPTSVDDTYNNDAVMADDLPDEQNGSYTYDLTLPNIECETCTLQVIQVMYKTQSGGFNGLYHRCADIALRGTPAADAMPGSADAMPGGFADAMPGGFADAATGGADAAMTGGNSSGASGGCQIASGGAGGATGALVLAASFLALALRRKKAASSARR